MAWAGARKQGEATARRYFWAVNVLFSRLAWWRWLPLALLAAACERPEAPVPPATLLGKEQVASVLLAVHLLEARVEASHLGGDSARALFLSEERKILQRNHISADDSTFERSYRYYSVHDKDLEEIYKVVLDSLSQRAAKMGAQPNPGHH